PCWPRRGLCWGGSRFPIARWHWRPPSYPLPLSAPLTWRSGCRGRDATLRSPPSATAAHFNPAASTFATAPPWVGALAISLPSMARRLPLAARSPRCWRTDSVPTAPLHCPRPSRRVRQAACSRPVDQHPTFYPRPGGGYRFKIRPTILGGRAEWANAAALKPAGRKARGFESLSLRHYHGGLAPHGCICWLAGVKCEVACRKVVPLGN